MDMSFFDYALIGVTAFNLGAIVWAASKLREYSIEISRQKARADLEVHRANRNAMELIGLAETLSDIASHKVSRPNGTVVLLQRKAKEALYRESF